MPIEASVQPVRRWPRRLNRGVLYGGAALLLAANTIILLYLARPRHRPDCEAASGTESPDQIVEICRHQCEAGCSLSDRARLAEALVATGEFAQANQLATGLLATELRSDALRILGQITCSSEQSAAESEEQEREGASAEKTSRIPKHVAEGLELMQRARKFHIEENRQLEITKDDRSLAECYLEADRYGDALEALDECITEAVAESPMELLCRINAARVLSLVGHFGDAAEQLKLAEPRISTDAEAARWNFESGNLKQEQARGMNHVLEERQAVEFFRKALAYAQRAQLSKFVLGSELNLAFSLAELFDLEEAAEHLDLAARSDPKGDYKIEREQLQARVLYRGGEFARAYLLNDRLYPSVPSGDDRLELCMIQARIALELKDTRATETWARRAIQEVQVINSQRASGLRPWVLASRLAPYEMLFTVLARTGRFDEAIEVFDQWQGQSFLAMEAPVIGSPVDRLSRISHRVLNIAKWLPAIMTSPIVQSSKRQVVESLRQIDLLAFVVAEDRLWRISAVDGQIKIDELGDYNALLKEQIRELRDSPNEPVLATSLSSLLVPDEVFHDSSTLHVVLDDRLADLPIAALRYQDRVLAAARPILHSPRLPVDTTCANLPPPRKVVVLGYEGERRLPNAQPEAVQVAQLFQVPALTSTRATRDALLSAKSADILHVAAHAGADDASGQTLELYGSKISALEIAAAGLNPAFVFLSACGSSDLKSTQRVGSLATAFLVSGSSNVVSAVTSVDDASTKEVVKHFYEEGGARDPVRALAAVQAKLADSSNTTWSRFIVSGRDVCRGQLARTQPGIR